MKRIRKLRGPTPGLADYLQHEQSDPSWEGFRDHQAGTAYRELVATLIALQHGICGYCEIDLNDLDRQIEHMIPRSDTARGSSGALDPANMIVCCTGGTSKNLFGPEAKADEERFLPPPRINASCGQAKGNRWDEDFIDPRKLPALPSVTKVRLDDRIEADRDACSRVDIPADLVNKTIEILGLSVERLRLARENRWNSLNDSWVEYFDDSKVLQAAARIELLSDENDPLPKFFTTNRSYFSPYGEGILAEPPQDWI